MSSILRRAKPFVALAVLGGLLGGCAVYVPPGPGYYHRGYYAPPPPPPAYYYGPGPYGPWGPPRFR
ncbi:MAG: hypothetical protein AB7P02_29930 [Alphaproteobacteria bacterium]